MKCERPGPDRPIAGRDHLLPQRRRCPPWPCVRIVMIKSTSLMNPIRLPSLAESLADEFHSSSPQHRQIAAPAKNIFRLSSVSCSLRSPQNKMATAGVCQQSPLFVICQTTNATLTYPKRATRPRSLLRSSALASNLQRSIVAAVVLYFCAATADDSSCQYFETIARFK